MDMFITVLAVILVVMFFSCLVIPFLLISSLTWPKTRQGRNDAITASLSVAIQAIIVFVVGTILPPGYTWSALGIVPGVLYGLVLIFCTPVGMKLAFFKAASFCLQALVVMFAVMCFVAMTVGGQENAPPLLSTTLLFQQLWIIAFIAGAAAPVLISIKRKGKS